MEKGCDKLEDACHLAGVNIIEDFIHHFFQLTLLIVVTAQISFTKTKQNKNKNKTKQTKKAKSVQLNESLRFIFQSGLGLKFDLY